VSRVAHVGRSRGLGFAGGRGCPEAYDIRVIGVLPPRDAGAIRLHGLGAAGLSADERRAGAKDFFNFQGKSDLAVSTIWPTCARFLSRTIGLAHKDALINKTIEATHALGTFSIGKI